MMSFSARARVRELPRANCDARRLSSHSLYNRLSAHACTGRSSTTTPLVCTNDAELLDRLPGALVPYEVVIERLMDSEKLLVQVYVTLSILLLTLPLYLISG